MPTQVCALFINLISLFYFLLFYIDTNHIEIFEIIYLIVYIFFYCSTSEPLHSLKSFQSGKVSEELMKPIRFMYRWVCSISVQQIMKYKTRSLMLFTFFMRITIQISLQLCYILID